MGYDHKYTYSHLGFNLKITDMQAAVGLSQLNRLTSFIEIRKRNFETLKTGLSELEDILVLADIGVETAGRLSAALAGGRFEKTLAPADVVHALADEIAAILEPVARPLEFRPGRAPQVVLVCGVNGSGKTTTIAKLAKQFK